MPWRRPKPYLCVLKAGRRASTDRVGTGPFAYTGYEPGRSFQVARNPSYWQEGKPYLDKLELTAVNDAAARVESLLSRQVDIVDAIDYSLLPTIRKASGYEVIELKNARWPTVVARLDAAQFTDRRVVEALKYAVDRQQLLDAVYSGAGSVAFDNPIPATGTVSGPARIERDVDRARSLLRKAGPLTAWTSRSSQVRSPPPWSTWCPR